MNLHDWMNATTDKEREALAAEARTTVAYLWQLSGGHRSPSKKLAERLEIASKSVTPDRSLDKVALIFGCSKAARQQTAA
jgi:hypothetical protein